MLALGTPMPDFSLPLLVKGLDPDLPPPVLTPLNFCNADATVIFFACAHCPYVHHIAPEVARVAADYQPRRVAFAAITSNDVAQYPQDAPELFLEAATDWGWRFARVYDETQQVAKDFHAACTPDFFVFDHAHRLAYRGQLDDSRPQRGPDRPGKGTMNGASLRAALDAILVGQPAPEPQIPSIGCSIKWKPGHEPSYFG